MKRTLLTGITGFVGSHLAEYLLSQKVEVYGIKRWRSPLNNISGIISRIKLHDCDLRDLSSLIHLFEGIKPDIIFHLAAQSFVPTSYTAPVDTLENNVIGTTNLLEAVRFSKIDPVIHVCSSSEVYGQVESKDIPIKEDCPFHPASPYAVSKVGEDMISYMYFVAYGLKIIRTRMFTHSVSKWTPVILRDSRSGLIDIKYISELRSAQKEGGYLSGRKLEDGAQMWDMSRSNLEVWNDNKWTKINLVSSF